MAFQLQREIRNTNLLIPVMYFRARSFLSTESIQQAYEDATGRFSSCFSFIKRYLNMDIWKSRGYVIWAVGITFSLFGYFIPLVHIVSGTSAC